MRVPVLGILTAICMAIAYYCIFFYAPIASNTGLIQKIFYTHVPLAWWGFISFAVIFVSSIAYLRSKKAFWYELSGAALEIGVLFSVLALLTGSIWAKYSWNIWWDWDPRLATTLIMCFIYTGQLIIRNLTMPLLTKRKFAAVLGIISFVNVPLVYFAAALWGSYHPQLESNGLAPKMLHTLFVCLGAFGALWLSLLLIRYKLLMAQDAHAKHRAQSLEA